MVDPITPDDSKDSLNRFHRLINPDESTEGMILPAGEPSSSEVNQNQISEGSAKITPESGTPTIDDTEKHEPSEEDSLAEPVVDNIKDNPTHDTPVEAGKQSVRQDNDGEGDNRIFPAIDEYGMPIPQRRNNVAKPYIANGGMPNPQTNNGTYAARRLVQTNPYKVTQTNKQIINRTASRSNKIRPSISIKQGMGCILRMFILAAIAGIVLLLIGGSIVLYEYSKIVATLPSVSDLQQRASTFETTRIFDRDGGLLYEILDPNAGRRTFITLDKISPDLIAATIATEDKSFYSHPGFDWTAILRAFWQNFQGGGTVSGASTITQQLARNLLMSPEERYEQSYIRKVREALLAAEITRRYSKDQILELYLNEFYYGNLAYGVEAAAETYFRTTADNLDLSQASFLAGLPQAPSVYDVYNNREAARTRQQQVLTLMYEASLEQGCIYVSNSLERVCVDAQTAVDAYVALENYQFQPPDVNIRYPHWVNYVRSILESQFDAQTIYHSGFSVYTTIDPDLQDQAQAIVKEQVDTLSAYNANNGALVAIRPNTGEILAMVGSADFYNDNIDGQVNMATSPTRQPGSSIKPITYLAAFEKGWTPATLIWDVPSEFPPSGIPDDPSPPYKPENYDGKFHGPVTVRAALANSYNIPAVKVLDYVGIYDNPDTMNKDGMLGMAEKMGISSLTRPDYGLSLTLGGGEVSLLEMTGAYSVIANGGNRMPPVAILRILDHNGNKVYEYQSTTGDQVISPEHSFLISSILSDNEARTPMFGSNSVLNLPFPAAAKTGTSNDFRDNWTIGYTPDITVGVWVGNADYSAMENITGLTGAAPIWSKFIQYAVNEFTGGNSSPFIKPGGIVDRVICSISGTEPSQWCPSQRSEYFTSDQLPKPSSEDLWTKVVFDTWTGLRTSNYCQDFTKDEFALNVTDAWAIGWLQNSSEGKAWVQEMGFDEPIKFTPPRACDASDSHPTIEISVPAEGQTITVSPLEISGKIDASADFKDIRLEYGNGDDPEEWNELFVSNQPISQPGKIYSWDIHSLPPGIITLKITMANIRGGYAERRIHLNIQVATPTPTVTPTATLTPTPTPTQIPSLTPTSTPSFTPSKTPTPVFTYNPTITQPPSFSKP